jgi:predicted Zn-dependent protease
VGVIRRRAIAGAIAIALSACAPGATGTGAARPAPAAGTPDDRLTSAGERSLREGRLAEAERLLGEAAAAAPADPRPLVGLAQVRFARRELPGALAALDRALALGGGPEALVLRGRYRGVARRFDDAAADLARAGELRPGDGDAWCGLAAVQIARGDEWESRWALSRALEGMDRAAALDRVWTLLLSMPPDPAQPQEALERCTRGRTAALDGRWEEAQHELLNGLRKATRFEWCITTLAESIWRLGEPGRAEGILRRLVASFAPAQPELHADARGKLAELLVERGEAGEAAELARAALAVRPGRPLLLDVLARACDAKGDAPCARDAYAALLARPHVPAEVRARAEARGRALGVAAGAATP